MRQFNKYPYQNLNDLNLDYVLRVAREARETLEELGGYSVRVSDLEKSYNELEYAVKLIENGVFSVAQNNSIIEAVKKNALDIFGNVVEFVFFGLTDDGHFVAYIPEEWSDLKFNTSNYDITMEGVEFGRLVLSY